MKIIDISDINKYDFSLKILCCLEYVRTNGEIYNCIGIPRTNNVLTFFKDCSAIYTLKDGTQIEVEHGDIVYAPIGSEYTCRFTDIKHPNQSTIGINFKLYTDETFEPFVLSDTILVFRDHCSEYKQLFSSISKNSSFFIHDICSIKVDFYRIISLLCNDASKKDLGKFKVISNAIEYMRESSNNDLSIKDIADMCSISESYFRKLFKEYAGTSPVNYLLRNKIEKAKFFLKYENTPIASIAQMLGFTDASYFTKKFKESVGIPPREYRNKHWPS